ncbi:hypothetical protein Micbo1qcDRAFT_176308 [Microdochium bolleyi]|uniref:Uncharacterized protein n=1 Tax=Microdochium bolleyi TaxID=196109 RepID=A0A136J006_9PEZI|nr:hypothetical protein Micbo1qcDRAFT_176308 [Microdochium bolleyi]
MCNSKGLVDVFSERKRRSVLETSRDMFKNHGLLKNTIIRETFYKASLQSSLPEDIFLVTRLARDGIVGPSGHISPLTLDAPSPATSDGGWVPDDATIVNTMRSATEGISYNALNVIADQAEVRNAAHDGEMNLRGRTLVRGAHRLHPPHIQTQINALAGDALDRQRPRAPESSSHEHVEVQLMTTTTTLPAPNSSVSADETSPIFAMEDDSGALDGEGGRQRAHQQQLMYTKDEKANTSDDDYEMVLAEAADRRSNNENISVMLDHHEPALRALLRQSVTGPNTAPGNYFPASNNDEDLYNASPVRSDFASPIRGSSGVRSVPSSPTSPAQPGPCTTAAAHDDGNFVNIIPEVTDAELLADNNYASGRTMPTVTPDGSFDFRERAVPAATTSAAMTRNWTTQAENRESGIWGRYDINGGRPRGSSQRVHDNTPRHDGTAPSECTSHHGRPGPLSIYPSLAAPPPPLAVHAGTPRNPPAPRPDHAAAPAALPVPRVRRYRHPREMPLDRGRDQPLAGLPEAYACVNDNNHSAADPRGNWSNSYHGVRPRGHHDGGAPAGRHSSSGSHRAVAYGHESIVTASPSVADLVDVYDRPVLPELPEWKSLSEELEDDMKSTF